MIYGNSTTSTASTTWYPPTNNPWYTADCVGSIAYGVNGVASQVEELKKKKDKEMSDAFEEVFT